MRDLLYPLGRALQLLGLVVTFVDVVLFFIQSMTMMFLLKIFLFGIATFYFGYFLSGLGTPRPRPIQPENPRTGKKGSREPSGPPEAGDKS